MNDPREFEDLEEEAWESFCEERGHEPSDIEEVGLRLADDEELGEEFEEWLQDGF